MNHPRPFIDILAPDDSTRLVAQSITRHQMSLPIENSPVLVVASAPGALATTGELRLDSPLCNEGPLMITCTEVFMIHDLRRQGLGISEIARRTGLDRKTVRARIAEGPGCRGMGQGRLVPA